MMYETTILSVCGTNLALNLKIKGNEKKHIHAMICATISISVLFLFTREFAQMYWMWRYFFLNTAEML